MRSCKGLMRRAIDRAKNVTIEYRWADGQYARFPEMAADLVRRRVAVIAVNTPAARIAKKAATTGARNGSRGGAGGFNPCRLLLIQPLPPSLDT